MSSVYLDWILCAPAGARLAQSAGMNSQVLNPAWANESMRKLEDEMRCASLTDASVMLTGESGVGKRFAANMIHQLSRRRRAPFVAIKAAEVAEASPSMMQGVATAKGGFLQAADDGTLLIQDIEDIPAPVQSQLLGFMDRATTAKKQARLMTATTTHLFRLVQAGEFRDDLFYRLNVIRFTIPPLRERPDDIPLLFHHYLTLDARTEAPPLSRAARRRLIDYSWPGNIRELRAVTKELSSLPLPDLIELEHLPCPIGG
jgi:DNA-binding NtrC family response regulator